MTTFLQDIRLALRGMRKSPTFTIIAVLSMALGIGATTAIFTVVQEMLLRPLPYKDADRLVSMREFNPVRNDSSPVRPANYFDWKQRTHIFDELAASRDNPPYILTGSGEPQSILGYRFDSNMFKVFGVEPEMGRTFTPDEDRPGNNLVVVLSHRLWKESFNSDPQIVAKSLTLSGRSYTVIGVMPDKFRHPQNALLWTPLALPADLVNDRQHTLLRPIGRLRPGVSIEDARRELNAVARQIAGEHPDSNKDWGAQVQSLTEARSSDIKPVLTALFVAVTLLLIIAATNVANLLTAKATGRRREFSIRVALGATRARLVRQLLSESIVLSLAGGVLGLLLAIWGTRLLVNMFPRNIFNLAIPNIEHLPVDRTVLLFCLSVSVLTGFLFGLLPAIQSSGKDVISGLHETSPFTASRCGRTTRSVLIVAEICIALVLLTGAGLALKTYKRLAKSGLGFDPDHVLTFYITMPPHKYKDATARRRYVDQLRSSVARAPGVTEVGATTYLPLSGFGGGLDFTVEGQDVAPGEQPTTDLQFATPRYLETLRIPLLAGRTFTDSDNASAPEVAVVSQTFARRFFGDSIPVGRRINAGTPQRAEWIQIVGVVGDVRESGRDEDLRPEIYLPYAQQDFPMMGFTIRTQVGPYAVASSVRQAVWAVDKDQPVDRVLSMEDTAKESLGVRKITTSLMTLFGAISLVLACVGIYGVIAYSVAQRTHEFGIRMALGATRSDLTALVLAHAGRLGAIGIMMGLLASFALSRFASALVYGISTRDASTFVLTPFVLAGIALLASLVPALRASRLDPLIALRQE